MTKTKILLVEDEPDTIVLYQQELARGGFEVLTASDADKALQLAAEHQPNLILLDIMLPGKSGFDVLGTLKKSPGTRDIPVLALTNLAEEVGYERAREMGVVGYVVKAEQTPQQVSQLIRQILGEEKRKPA